MDIVLFQLINFICWILFLTMFFLFRSFEQKFNILYTSFHVLLKFSEYSQFNLGLVMKYLCFGIRRCPNLEILSVKNSQSVTDTSMIKIALGCHMLTELDISSCYEISYKSLELIGQNCPNLTVLKRNLLNWLDPSQHAGIVPDDYINACPQDGDREALVIAKFMPKLKHLELRFSKLFINGLISISEGCTDIETLDLFGCVNLTSRALDQTSKNMKNLKVLVRPNFYIPRSVFHTERYGHWRLYDERFQTNVFQI